MPKLDSRGTRHETDKLDGGNSYRKLRTDPRTCNGTEGRLGKWTRINRYASFSLVRSYVVSHSLSLTPAILFRILFFPPLHVCRQLSPGVLMTRFQRAACRLVSPSPERLRVSAKSSQSATKRMTPRHRRSQQYWTIVPLWTKRTKRLRGRDHR